MDAPSDPQLLSVSPRNFKEQLEVLNQLCRPATLSTCAQSRRQGRPLVALTFDDGYVDNFEIARPLLEVAAVPATFFVPSGFVDTDKEFYWDELARLLLGPNTPEGSLAVKIGNEEFSWEFTNSGGHEKYEEWNVTMSECPSTRHRAYVFLCATLKRVDASSRQKVLDQVSSFCGASRHGSPVSRVMDSDEIAEFVKSDLVEIGAHSVTHASLPYLPILDAIREIKESKKTLESIIGRDVKSFAFPYGERTDYSPATVQAVRDAGYSQACINCPGLLVRRAQVMMLPRFGVRDWDGEEFSRRISSWLTQTTDVYL